MNIEFKGFEQFFQLVYDYGQEYARRIPRNRHNYTRYYSPKQIHRPEEVNAAKRFL